MILTATSTDCNNPYFLKGNNVEIDINMLYEVAENDLPYIQLMLKTFIKNMPSTLQKIKDGIERKDWDEVYKTTHFAKSSLSIIKIEKIFREILLLEKCSKNKTNFEHADSIIQTINVTYRIVEKLIVERIEKMNKA